MTELTVKSKKHKMTQEQVIRYLFLVERRLFILMHSGVDGLPEYEQELADIDKELLELRKIVDAELEVAEPAEPTEEEVKEKMTMKELTVKKTELRARQKEGANGYLPRWEVVSVTYFSDDTVNIAVIDEFPSSAEAREHIQKYMENKEHFTPEMIQAAEKAQNYSYQSLYDRFPHMSPVEVIAECREVLRIYDILQQAPEPLGLDAISSNGFGESMLFLESFCMRYLVDIFFNGQ